MRSLLESREDMEPDDMQTDVMELPLFPLNAVLFPGQALPLHIFEPRYRVMIQRCVDNDEPFGVVLAQEDDPDDPYSVGTIAHITQMEKLPDGRLNIMTYGVERFLISAVRMGEDGYLIGDVTPYPFGEEAKPPRGVKRAVSRLLKRYLALLETTNGVELEYEKVPRNSGALAVFAAIALQLSLEEKQELLSLESVSELLTREAEILTEEVLFLGIMAKSPPPELVKGYDFLLN